MAFCKTAAKLMLGKIGVIGGGNIGGVLAQECAKRNLAKTVGLMDIAEPDLAKGKMLDISEGNPVTKCDAIMVGSRTYEVLDGCDLIINTAGVPRKKGPDGKIPSREQLLAVNLKVTQQVAEGITKYAPNAFVINIANPLDAIVYTLYKKMKINKNRLMGMAGVLDSARYRLFVAQAAGVSVENVEALVLGGHGDDMVPIRSCCRIAGMPVEKFLSDKVLTEIEVRTRKAGAEVVNLLGVGSAFVSPAWSALEMAEAIIYDKKKILASCVLLEGEYGVKGLFVGVPCVLGKNGIEKIIECELSEKEKAMLATSCKVVSDTCAEVDSMLK
jgi:malate dehydrogenase